MANNRKRVLARNLRRLIISDAYAAQHWEWVEMTQDTRYERYADVMQRWNYARLDTCLSMIWHYRIKPDTLRLPEDISEWLFDIDNWFEYLTGIPVDKTEAVTPWSRRLSTN